MNYYYADKDNNTLGPVSEDELHGLHRQGQISRDTFVIAEGENDWKAYQTILPQTALVSRPPMPPAPQRRGAIQTIELAPTQKTKECPFCSEEISLTAKKCKHCGETLDVALRAAEEAKRSGSNQPMVFMNAAGGGVAMPQKKSFPHLLHLVLTIVTMGVWLIIWIPHYLFRSRSKYD